MDIYQFAMKMEKDGENYYRELGAHTNQSGLKQILNLLANEEVKHFQIIEKMSQKKTKPSVSQETLFDSVKTIFQSLSETEKIPEFKSDEIDLYRKALDIEKQSHRFYVEKSEEVEEESSKELLRQLAAEENKHAFLIENLIEFMRRPNTWLENAEWYHLDEY